MEIPKLRSGSIILGWADAHEEAQRNFGDALSPYIVSRLSGKRILHAPCARRLTVLRELASLVIRRRWSRFRLASLFSFLICPNYLLAVGSIIRAYKAKGGIVWGSGIISREDEIAAHDYRAVRGPLTRQHVQASLNRDIPEVYGDPALLLPLIYTPRVDITHEYGVIAHVTHSSSLDVADLAPTIKKIYLHGSDIEKTIDQIFSCRRIISTSLHGVIVAHAYGREALWIKLAGRDLLGDDVKFFDYLASVGVEDFQPDIISDFGALDDVSSLWSRNADWARPSVDLGDIRRGLAAAAPFDVNIATPSR